MSLPPALSEEDALRAYARMMHHLSTKHVEEIVSDDFCYASQQVLSELIGKEEFLGYMRPKLETIKRAGVLVWAELAYLKRGRRRPCLILSQGEKDNRVGTVLAETEGARLKRIDLCVVPSPAEANGTGEFPS